jgi:hypothetical protein
MSPQVVCDDLVHVLANPDTEDMEMCFPEQLVKVLSKPDTEDMEMCFSEQSSFHLGGNLYLIAEQDGILRKYICCVPNNVQHRLCHPK